MIVKMILTMQIIQFGRQLIMITSKLLTERLKGTTAVTSSLIGALFSEIKSTLKVDFVEAASKLDTIKTAADNVESTLEKMFTDDDHIAVYIFCSVVLIICLITLV